MDVHAQLARIRSVVEDARSMPMSASAVVNRRDLLRLLDELSAGLDAALAGSEQVVTERDSVVAGGQDEAERIIAAALQEKSRMVAGTDVIAAAEQEAADLLARARREAEELRVETDDYVDAKLAHFEITLERTTEAVKRGRERLAGGTAFDDLTPDAAARVRLPEHLED